ncbi:unnamed protein product, partial [Dracunculus medinensis]|uniref:G_PROTEIN_RECEP_F1_2 domain-containing protein n=1 Tax=Dracunculus medinensis TaxID=318479 RepID=A0A0N4U0L1_DRAME
FDFLDIKIYLIGVFAASIAILSIYFNTFFTIVFTQNPSLRRTPIYYFGILAIVDIIMAFNYIALMVVPVYMDQFGFLWLYHIFLSYLRPVITESNIAMFSSLLLILFATTERLMRTFKSQQCFTIMERNRPNVCLLCIVISMIYKTCIYFEIHYVELSNLNPSFILTLYQICCNNFQDATRALVSVVTMYLMSQSLQVVITFCEAFHKHSLENDYYEYYSYINDLTSIMTLLSSCLRFPVYYICNRPIKLATQTTLKRLNLISVKSKSTAPIEIPSKTMNVENGSQSTKISDYLEPTRICNDNRNRFMSREWSL